MPSAPGTSAERIREVNTAYHDVAAETYDSKWGIDFGATGQAQVRAKLRKALGVLPPEPFGTALEIGAGTGYFSLNLLQLGLIEKATATDISPGMLASLEANAAGLGVAVSTEVSDAELLPFADRSFDLVFGHAVLHHIPDLERAFAELHRVLRPGGALAFCGEPSRHGDRLAALPKRAGRLLAPAWRSALGASPAAANHGPSEDHGHALEGEVDVHSFTPTDLGDDLGGQASKESGSVAKSCSPTSGAGAFARSRRAPNPTPFRSHGGGLPSAATWPCSGSTSRCWSRACPRRSSTTWSSRPAKPRVAFGNEGQPKVKA